MSLSDCVRRIDGRFPPPYREHRKGFYRGCCEAAFINNHLKLLRVLHEAPNIRPGDYSWRQRTVGLLRTLLRAPSPPV